MARRQTAHRARRGPAGIPGATICIACRRPLREDRTRGERVCANPGCEKYAPGAEALPAV